jgi:hypothetical protein
VSRRRPPSQQPTTPAARRYAAPPGERRTLMRHGRHFCVIIYMFIISATVRAACIICFTLNRI